MANLLKRKDKKKFLKVATEKDTVLKERERGTEGEMFIFIT